MARSLKASEEGLKLVEKARNQKGWNKQASVWSDRAEVSRETLKRFRGGIAIERDKFIRICQVVGIDHQKVVDFDPVLSNRHFWGSAPDVEFFCSRKTELTTLTQWIINDKCRLIGITAMGGMGKSYLATKLAHNLKSKFSKIYWMSLREAPLIDHVLEDLIKFISNQQEIELTGSLDARLVKLLSYLTEKRWLIIFDNVESILESNAFCGEYRPDYQNYSQLFNKLGSCSHNSCVIVTSREQLPEIKCLAGETAPVRILELMGMDDGAIGILRRKGINADEILLQQLIQEYQGNPLALEIAAAIIKQTFQNDIDSFLAQRKTSFQGINKLLEKQFFRLSLEEKTLMYWLAIYREPVKIFQFKTDIFLGLAPQKIVSTLDSLKNRSLLQVTETGYTLQNVVIEYTTELIINTAVEEIETGQLKLLDTHSLIQATATDYIRICQYQVIVKPILDAFNKLSAKQLANLLLKTIVNLRDSNSDLKYGYAPGNMINLLIALKTDLTGTNFSGLTIRQAYLQGIPLHQVNFSNCHFHNSLFSHAIGSILTVTFSPDQTLLATGGTDGYLRIWRVSDGQEVMAWQAHSDWIRVLTFSNDGQLIASGSNDKIIKIWQWEKQECQQILRGHTDWIWSLKFAKKDNVDLLISTSSDNTARVWHIDTGNTVYTYKNLPELAGVVWSVAFSPDQQTFASGSATKVQLWNINTREWIKDIPSHATRVRALCFSPDGKMLVGSNDRQEIVVWQVSTGECLEILPVSSTAAIWSLQYTPDGAELISSGTEIIQLWDMVRYEPLVTLQQPHHRVRSVAYSEEKKLLAVGSDDQMIRLWDTERGQSVRSFFSHLNRVWTLAVGNINNSTVIASGSDDGQIRLWNGETGELINTFSGHEGRVRSVDFSKDGKFLVSSSNDRTIRVWNLATPGSAKIYREHTDWVWKVFFLNKSKSLISLSDDKTILHWNLQTGEIKPFFLSQQEWIWTATISPQEDILVLAGDNQSVDLWDINTKEKITSYSGHQHRIKAISFNQLGNLLVSASDDNTIKVWNVKTQKCIHTLENSQRETRSLIVIPTTKERGELIVSAGDDCLIKVINLKTGDSTTLEGHTSSIWSLCYSLNLDRLYSCGEDETIKCWDLDSDECVGTLYIPKLYEGMNIFQITGLNKTTVKSLQNLGAKL